MSGSKKVGRPVTRTPEYVARNIAQAKLWYDRRRAAGICTQCGKQKAAPERTKCQPCLALQLAKWRERRENPTPKPWERPAPKPLTAYPHKRTTAGDARQALGYCPSAGSIALSFFGRVVSHWHR